MNIKPLNHFRKFSQDKRGQADPTGIGIVIGLVAGVGSLIFTVILIFVLVQTIVNANLIVSEAVVTEFTVTNESGAFVNLTGYSLAEVNSSNSGYTITEVWASASNVTETYLIPAANYTVSSGGNLTNATIVINATQYDDANVSYTFTHTGPDRLEKAAVTRLRGNFTEGIDNVSLKIPTILLIGAVVVLFGALALLVFVARRMGFLGGGSGGGL